jgi:HSP20 family protein
MFQPLVRFGRNSRTLQPTRDHEPSDPFFRLQAEMNRLFSDAFSGLGALGAFEADRAVPVRFDMRETDREIIIEAEIPGVDEKDIDLQLVENVLTIRGEKKLEKKGDREGEYRYVERAYGAFTRTIPLPPDVDPDRVSAVCRNGLLTVTIGKSEDSQSRARRIEIRKG